MAMLALADIAFFLGFLAISIGNGIVMNDLGGGAGDGVWKLITSSCTHTIPYRG